MKLLSRWPKLLRQGGRLVHKLCYESRWQWSSIVGDYCERFQVIEYSLEKYGIAVLRTLNSTVSGNTDSTGLSASDERYFSSQVPHWHEFNLYAQSHRKHGMDVVVVSE